MHFWSKGGTILSRHGLYAHVVKGVRKMAKHIEHVKYCGYYSCMIVLPMPTRECSGLVVVNYFSGKL